MSRPVRIVIAGLAIGLLNNGVAAEQAPAEGPLRVSVSSADPVAPIEVRNIHRVQCREGTYELLEWPFQGKLEFAFNAGAGRRAFDLSGSEFAKTLAKRQLFGYYGFSCGGGQNLSIQYWGLRLLDGAEQPRPFSYRLYVSADGEILQDLGVKEETVETLMRVTGSRNREQNGN